jgi:hypothetical protein
MIAERILQIPCVASILLAVCLGGSPTCAKYGGGSGTPDDPYQIWTAEQMNAIGAEPNDWDKHFKLMADVDLGGCVGDNRFRIIAHYDRFTGSFDGNGNRIVNFAYQAQYDYEIGLFGCLWEPARIENVILVNPRVDAEGSTWVGALVGWLQRGTIANCRVEGGSIAGGQNVGGLVGWNGTTEPNDGGAISDCQSSARVSGSYAVGGLAGVNYDLITLSSSSGDATGGARAGGLVGVEGRGSITQSYATGSVSGKDAVGGLIGYNAGGIVSECCADGPVSGTSAVGGLIGNNIEWLTWGPSLFACYATADVSASTQAGGLVGFNGELAAVAECYSTGRVSVRTSTGGLIGLNIGQVDGCFWDVETSGRLTSAGGVGKSTAEMQVETTFLDWCRPCVAATWTIDEGHDYPRFAWENRPGETLTIGISNFLPGGGTSEDPYLVRTAEDVNVISLFPCEQDRHFRLAFLAGEGTDQSPYLIRTADDLDLLGRFPYELDAQFKLMAHVDLRDYTGHPFHSMRSFAGVFDGNGKTISHFSCALPDQNCVGLFGRVSGSRTYIRNLGLIDPHVTGGACVGSLAGYAQDVTIENCYVQGGRVKGQESVGGLVGRNEGTLSACYSAGRVSGDMRVGGLAGDNAGIIRHCYATQDVGGDVDVGGLVGLNTAWCERIDYAPSGHEYVCHIGYIYHCYSAGPIAGNAHIGGFVGDNESLVVGCFWDIDTSGWKSSAGGTGMKTAQMWTARTFLNVGWDFVGETANGTEDAWRIREGRDYPRLRWEPIPE